MKRIPPVTLEEATRILADHEEMDLAVRDLVGRMIHQYRVTHPGEARMTRPRLAGLMCVTTQTIYNWECGAHRPNADKFRKLCEILLAPGRKGADSNTKGNQQP